jgi:hypothetical protein
MDDQERSPSPVMNQCTSPLLQQGDPFATSHCCSSRWRNCAFISSLTLNIITFVGIGTFMFWFTHTNDNANPPSSPSQGLNRTCPYSNVSASLSLAVTYQSSDSLAVCWPHVAYEPRLIAPYRLMVDDWWLNSTTLLPVYAGNDEHFQFKGLLPGVPYRVQLMAEPFRTPPIRTEPFLLHTLERPQCGNLQDLIIHRAAENNDMPGKVKRCLLNSGGNQQASIDCITRQVGLSSNCASCWAGELPCILLHCVAPCMSPESDHCHHCLNTQCVPHVAACAGLPLWVYNITTDPLQASPQALPLTVS